MDRRNSYDFIRLFAAGLVIFSHSFALTGNAEPNIGGQLSFGRLGVLAFFILSGYMIYKSWNQYPRVMPFFIKRALRIFPALVACTLLTILVTGLFFTSLSPGAFFTAQGTITYLNNIFLYSIPSALPGVFVDNVYPGAVNGSLWTLRYEFTMYLVVAIIGATKLRRKINVVMVWVALLAMSFVTARYKVETELFYMQVQHLFPMAAMFFSGIVVAKYEAKIKFDWRLGFLSLGLFLIGSAIISQLTVLFAATLLAYGLFALGKAKTMSFISKIGDFSYGLYIYAFPIQQMVWHLTQTQSPIKMFGVSLVLTLAVSVLSWFYIEKPVLKLKVKINPEKYPVLTQENQAW